MSPRDLLLLFALAALWGASFAFIKVAVAEIAPLMLVALRLVLASATLLLVGAAFGRRLAGDARVGRPFRELWRPYLVVAVLNAIVPYGLIAWGEEAIASGTASILNATTPLWSAVIAGALGVGAAVERLTPARVAGLVVGFLGVAVVVLGSGARVEVGAEGAALLGQGAVLGASLSYAVAGLYARGRFAGLPPLAPAIWQNVVGMILLLPIALVWAPLERVPSLPALGSVAALGIGGTGLALVVYYALLARVGATRTVMVTYLLPVMALGYGALLLGEQVGVWSLAGLALVLLGVTITARAGAR